MTGPELQRALVELERRGVLINYWHEVFGIVSADEVLEYANASRIHADTCVVNCTDRNNDPEDTGDHPFHTCWCAQGALSYDDFKTLHPEWATMWNDEWLDTRWGIEWRREMQP